MPTPPVDGNSPPSREALLASVTAEADGFYSQMATIASGFLGGTLLLMEKIAPNPGRCTLVILAAGWISLIVVLIMVVTIRYLNLMSAGCCARQEFDKAAIIDLIKDVMGALSILIMGIGMSSIFLFGFVNIWVRPPHPGVAIMSEEKKDEMPKANEKPLIKEGGIRYSDFMAPPKPQAPKDDKKSDGK